MSLQGITSFELLPSGISGSTSFANGLIDASGEKVAMIFRVRSTGTINTIGFPVTTITTSDTLRVSLQTVDSSGNPSGTLYGGSTAGTLTPSANTYHTATLGTGATATAGDIVAAVVEFDSYVAGNLNIGYYNAGGKFPYTNLYTGTWAKSVGVPAMAIGYDTGTFLNVGSYPCTMSAVAFNSSSGTNENAQTFKFPFNTRIYGISMMCVTSSTSDYDVVLYDYNGTSVLTTKSMPGAYNATTTSRTYVTFPTSVALLRNQYYRIGIKPTTANNITVYRLTFLNTAIMNAIPGAGNVMSSSRSGSGAWTDSSTSFFRMGLLLDQVDDGLSTARRIFDQVD